jgi:hypothetical protein
MTPDLKIACELVFQEHKLSSQPIKWGRDAFRGKISFGLSEMAKETLVKKNIILLPDKSKKVFTQLNPDVANASSFEEAEKMVGTKIPGQATATAYEINSSVADHAPVFAAPTHSYNLQSAALVSEAHADEAIDSKWWLKPLYLYFVWPVCGAVAGVLISLLMNLAYTGLFSGPK